MYKDSYIVHFEVFYDYKDSSDDIEVIMSLFNNGEVQWKQFGNLDYLFDKMKEDIEPNNKIITFDVDKSYVSISS